jgi:hypothetical protein
MRTALAALLLLTACTTTPSTPPATSPASTFPVQAPWRGDALTRAQVPAAYITQWEKAENRAACALIALASVGEAGAGATPRGATFSGGWSVAYDLPNLRSAFGVAGTGVDGSGSSYTEWPYVHTWEDGSKVEYGPEGGQGPNELAYLRIEGQQCLYNIWSRLGIEHLELLIRELRRVQ